MVSGWKGSGKDTVVGYLSERYGLFQRFAFADELKDNSARCYQLDRSSMDDVARKESPILTLPVVSKDTYSGLMQVGKPYTN